MGSNFMEKIVGGLLLIVRSRFWFVIPFLFLPKMYTIRMSSVSYQLSMHLYYYGLQRWMNKNIHWTRTTKKRKVSINSHNLFFFS